MSHFWTAHRYTFRPALAKDSAFPGYISHLLRSKIVLAHIESNKTGVAQYNLSLKQVGEIEIPLPPLEVQKVILAEIDSYQKVIDGARTVLDNYRPQISIDPAWPFVPIGDLVDSSLIGLVKNKAEQNVKHKIPYIKMNNITSGGNLDLTNLVYVDATKEEVKRYALNDGDFIYNTRNAPNLVGKSAVYHGESGKYLFNNNIFKITFGERTNSDFVNAVMNSEFGKEKILSQVDGTTSVAALYQKNYMAIEIPLPPIEIQKKIIAEIETEQVLVASNHRLVEHFEKKIQNTIARVWKD